MIYCGDGLSFIESIEKNSIDLILTDPPYAISKSSFFEKTDVKSKFSSMTHHFGDWDLEEIDLQKMFIESHRVLKRGGTLITFYDIWKSGLVKEAALNARFKQPRVGQWLKTNPVPLNSKRNYLSNSAEYFFSFVKDKKPTFHSEYDNAVYKYPLCYGKKKTIHKTQKPLGLFEELIQKHSNRGDIVLDMFSGSGTTAVACENLGREYICIEKDEKYYDISIDRLNEVKQLKM